MVCIHSLIKYVLSDCVGEACYECSKYSLRGYVLGSGDGNM